LLHAAHLVFHGLLANRGSMPKAIQPPRLERALSMSECFCSVLLSVWLRREAAKLSSIVFDAGGNQRSRQQGPSGACHNMAQRDHAGEMTLLLE
jgi:hypothetical protein